VAAAEYAVKPSTTEKAVPLPVDRPKKRPAAIVVAHGMGQQIPFQTLDDVAEGLLRHSPRRSSSKPIARTVTLGDERLQRLELKLDVGDGERDVHIYEAYWAPLTQGRVNLRDVAGFLLRGGLAGVKSGLAPFKRWLFGEYEAFPAPVRTVLYLISALAVIAALAFLSTLIVVIVAARAPLRDPPGWLHPAMFRDVTTVLNLLITALAPFAALMVAWRIGRSQRAARTSFHVPGWLTVPAFLLALFATLAAAVTAASVVAYHAAVVTDSHPSFFDAVGPSESGARQFDAVFDVAALWMLGVVAAIGVGWSLGVMSLALWRSLRKQENARGFTLVVSLTFVVMFGSLAVLVWYLFQSTGEDGRSMRVFRQGLAWPLVIVVAAVVRSFLIQYAGDVAAYIQPQVVDRFFELRTAIKNTVWRTAHAVYGATEYDDIILVGHSLGSVVVYDVLNRLLIDRALGGPQAPEIASRTRLLLTFGSPLDKTAFIFGKQGTGSEAREALAASVQPLITEEVLRPPWVNIYSRWDLISGALDYYDRPHRSNRHAIENVKDDDAGTLFAAHVEYWQNSTMFKTILKALGRSSLEIEQTAHLHHE
jgi:hypothetical protein